MRNFILIAALCVASSPVFAVQDDDGLRGDPEAIALARSMVDTMGGEEFWAELETLHFVHDWYPYYRTDGYREDEILDLTGPRSWVEMRNEIYHRARAYSPEHGYWSVENGVLTQGNDARLQAAMQRSPYNLYRFARGVARNDPFYELTLADGDIPGSRQIEIRGEDGYFGGYIILTARHEPLIWGTNDYRYTFGPMEQYGNLRHPRWAVYDNGGTRYELVSLAGSSQAVSDEQFAMPDAVTGSGEDSGRAG